MGVLYSPGLQTVDIALCLHRVQGYRVPYTEVAPRRSATE